MRGERAPEGEWRNGAGGGVLALDLSLDLAPAPRDDRVMPADFLTRDVPALKKRVFRLGLSGSFGIDEAAAREGLERIQYVFWFPQMKGLTPALRDAIRRDRARYVIASGPFLGHFPGPGAAGGREPAPRA